MKVKKKTKQRRVARYIKMQREDKKIVRAMLNAYKDDGFSCERNLVEKLRIKKGGKSRERQLSYEAWCEEMSSLCPNP